MRQPDVYVANGRAVADRIEAYYGVRAEVVHPPIDERWFSFERRPSDFLLVVARLVEQKRVDIAIEAAQRLKDLARTARLKGFRPGKVPLPVVRKQYGGQVHHEAVTDLMQKSFAEAVSQEKLRPAGDPRIEPLQVEPGAEPGKFAGDPFEDCLVIAHEVDLVDREHEMADAE